MYERMGSFSRAAVGVSNRFHPFHLRDHKSLNRPSTLITVLYTTDTVTSLIFQITSSQRAKPLNPQNISGSTEGGYQKTWLPACRIKHVMEAPTSWARWRATSSPRAMVNPARTTNLKSMSSVLRIRVNQGIDRVFLTLGRTRNITVIGVTNIRVPRHTTDSFPSCALMHMFLL